MKSWLRVLLVVCLSIVLPLQALAGAAMLDCGGAVSGIEAASHDHAAHDAGAHPSQQSVHGDHASHDSPSSPGTIRRRATARNAASVIWPAPAG